MMQWCSFGNDAYIVHTISSTQWACPCPPSGVLRCDSSRVVLCVEHEHEREREREQELEQEQEVQERASEHDHEERRHELQQQH